MLPQRHHFEFFNAKDKRRDTEFTEFTEMILIHPFVISSVPSVSLRWILNCSGLLITIFEPHIVLGGIGQ